MNISYYTNFLKKEYNLNDQELANILHISLITLNNWYKINLNKSNPYKIKKLYQFYSLSKEKKSLKEIKKIISKIK